MDVWSWCGLQSRFFGVHVGEPFERRRAQERFNWVNLVQRQRGMSSKINIHTKFAAMALLLLVAEHGGERGY